MVRVPVCTGLCHVAQACMYTSIHIYVSWSELTHSWPVVCMVHLLMQHSMHTDVRASSASSVCSPATLVLVTVAVCAGVEGLSGDAPCDDDRDVRRQIKAVIPKMLTKKYVPMDGCTRTWMDGHMHCVWVLPALQSGRSCSSWWLPRPSF